jgi:hypothetical protein
VTATASEVLLRTWDRSGVLKRDQGLPPPFKRDTQGAKRDAQGAKTQHIAAALSSPRELQTWWLFSPATRCVITPYCSCRVITLTLFALQKLPATACPPLIAAVSSHASSYELRAPALAWVDSRRRGLSCRGRARASRAQSFANSPSGSEPAVCCARRRCLSRPSFWPVSPCETAATMGQRLRHQALPRPSHVVLVRHVEV